MYHQGMKWEEYLEHQGFKDDILRGLERQARDMVQAQERVSQQVTDAQRIEAAETRRTLDRGFGQMVATAEEMSAVVQRGFGDVSYGLDRVAGGIEALRSDFDWAMGALLWKLEMQNATLQGILATLQAPLDTQARELRRRAEDAYLNGWYDEALADLLESEQKNYQDFAVHQAIGNIYLYHRRPAGLDNSREYYLKAGKYATPRSARHAALGFLHAGWVCYLQGNPVAAIEHTRRAIDLYPAFTEAFYNHAKFAAVAGRADLAIPSLKQAIGADRNYAVKARADADFDGIEAEVTGLLDGLRREARQEAEAAWHPMREDLDSYAIPPGPVAEEFARFRAEIESLMAQDTLFGYQDVPARVPPCRKIWEGLRLPERDRLRDEATEGLVHLRAEIADYVLPDGLRQEWSDNLESVERLLDGVPTFESVQAAVVALEDHREEWNPVLTEWSVSLEGHTDEVSSVAFSPDGAKLASGSWDRSVRMWDLATMRELAVLRGHSMAVTHVAFSPDGAMLASCGGGQEDGTVRLWDVATGQEIAVLQGHAGCVDCVAFSPDGTMLASCGALQKDCGVRLWDVRARRELAVLRGHTRGVVSVAFSPDGARLVSGSWDKTVRLWDVRKRSELGQLTGHSAAVTSVVFSVDGETVASGSYDNTVRLWNTSTRRELAVLKGHTAEVVALAISPDGELLASRSGASEGTIRLWQAVTGRELVERPWAYSHALDMAFSPDGVTLASGGGTGIRLWVRPVHQDEWLRLEQKRQERLRLQRQRESWRAVGCCEECGVKLGVLDKVGKHTRCPKHRGDK